MAAQVSKFVFGLLRISFVYRGPMTCHVNRWGSFVQDFAIGRVGPNRKCRILRSGEPNTAKDASEVLSIAKSCTLSPERQARARAEGPDAAQAKKHTHERKQAATRPRSGQQKTDAPATAGCVPDGISSRWPTRKAAGASAIRKNARQYDGNRPNRR